MGEPFGKASGRTFEPMSTHASNPYWNSPLVTSDGFPKINRHPKPWKAVYPCPVMQLPGYQA